MKTKKQKKDLLKNILQALIGYRDLAEGLLIITQDIHDDNLINSILTRIQNGIKSIKSKREREKIKKKIKQIYKKSEKKTQKDKEDADELLEDFIKSI